MNIYFYAAQKEKQDLLDKKMKENALFCISLGVLFFFQIIRMRSIFLGIISTSNLVFSIAFTLFICVKFIGLVFMTNLHLYALFIVFTINAEITIRIEGFWR